MGSDHLSALCNNQIPIAVSANEKQNMVNKRIISIIVAIAAIGAAAVTSACHQKEQQHNSQPER